MRVDIAQGPIRVLTCSSDSAFYRGINYGVTILFTDSVSSKTTKGFIEESGLNQFGERACLHMQLNGSLIATAKGNVTYGSSNTSLYVDHRLYEQVRTTHYVSTSSGPQVFSGTVFVNHIPDYYREDFPDSVDIPYSYRANKIRNAFLEVIKTSDDTFTYHEQREVLAYPYTGQEWRTHHMYDYVVLNKARTSRGWCVLPVIKQVGPNPVTPYNLGVLPTTKVGFQNVFDRLRRNFRYENDSDVYGDLVRRCANDAKTIPTNSIELVAELATIAATVKATYGLTKGRIDAKKIASGYLSYKYGLRLTAMDLTTVVKGLAREFERLDRSYDRSRAREVINYISTDGEHLSSVVYNYKMMYRPYDQGVLTFLRNWFDSGLFPSLTNAWDLIPFSFVVDWFFNVGKHLDAIDANTYWSLYDILGTVYSRKETFKDVAYLFNQAGWTLVGACDAVFYNRRLGTEVHSPLFFEPASREFKNYAELTSLIVANKRQSYKSI